MDHLVSCSFVGWVPLKPQVFPGYGASYHPFIVLLMNLLPTFSALFHFGVAFASKDAVVKQSIRRLESLGLQVTVQPIADALICPY